MGIISTVLISEHSLWWLCLVFVVALSLSIWLYRKKKTWEETPRGIVALMFSLRLISLFLLGALLIKPLLNIPNTHFYKSQLLILQDQSKSILNNQDSLAYTQAYNQKLNEFTDALKASEIPYKLYGFADSISSQNKIVFDKTASNISEAIKHVNDINTSEHIGGILLLSDGIYNQGEDPYYLSQTSQIPIYTVGLGDTNTYSDLKIDNIKINKVAYNNRNIPFNIDIASFDLKGKQHQLKVIENDKVLFESTFDINKTQYYKSIEQQLSALSTGMHILKFELSVDETERNIENNRFTVAINVIDRKQKVLILNAAPHPDIAALKTALKSSQSFEIEQINLKDFKGQIDDYNLVVLHQIPFSKADNSRLYQQLESSKTAVLHFVSPQSNIRKLDELNPSTKISKAIKKNEWYQAAANSNFKLFNLSDELKAYIDEVPPLIAPMLKVQKSALTNILAYQKIKNIETDDALIFFNEIDNKKRAFVLGEGIWKWKVYDFKQNGDFNNFSLLIEKIVQYLCVENTDKDFIVDIKNQYSESEKKHITAQYYNKSMELDLKQVFVFEYSNTEGQSFSKPMSVSDKDYHIDLSYLPSDIYAYKIYNESDSTVNLAEGSFSVLPSQLEMLDTKARHQLLSNISQNSQAKFYNEQNWFNVLNDLKEHPKFKTQSYTSFELIEWINFKWILLLITLLISLEWFLRKYFGSI
jgi:hypothetical protein